MGVYDNALPLILKSGFKDVVKEGKVTFHFKSNNVWHRVDTYANGCTAEKADKLKAQGQTQSKAWYINAQPHVVHKELIPMTSIINKEVCNTCLREISDYNYGAYHSNSSNYKDEIWSDPNYQKLKTLLKTEASLKKVHKLPKEPNSSLVKKRLDESKSLLEEAQKIIDAPGLKKVSKEHTALYEEIADNLLKLGEEAHTSLSKFLRSDENRNKLAEKVQKELVPKNFHNQEFALDSSMKLIGISPGISSAGGYGVSGNLVASIVELFAVRNDTETVLYAPAYFYTYLFSELFAKNKNYGRLVVPAEITDDEILVEVAASLWAPRSENAHACLSQSVASAELLQG